MYKRVFILRVSVVWNTVLHVDLCILVSRLIIVDSNLMHYCTPHCAT